MRQRLFENLLVSRIHGVFQIVQNTSPGKLQAFSFSETGNLFFVVDVSPGPSR